MNMVYVQTISVVIAAASVVAFVVNSIITSRKTEKTQELALKSQQQTLETRQAQMFMSIYQTDYSDEFLEALHRVMEMELRDSEDLNKIRRDIETYKAWTKVASYLEGIGVLVREKLVDVRMVTLLSSGFIKWYWGHFGPGVLRIREEMSFPRYLVEVEYLAERVEEYGKNHPELSVASPDYTAHVARVGGND
jgi:hypothetical protein